MDINKPLIALLVALFLVSSSLATTDVPFIVAHKKATLNRLKSGAERVSVSIDIYNQGTSCRIFIKFIPILKNETFLFFALVKGQAIYASNKLEYSFRGGNGGNDRTTYDVSLVDDRWPNDMFDVIKGNTSQSWERLDAGGILSHNFELEAKVKGLFHGSPAVITFRIPTKPALQVAFSTPILPLDVLAERPPEKKLEWAKRLLAKYGSLISVVTIVVLFVYLVASPSKSSAAKASKKRR